MTAAAAMRMGMVMVGNLRGSAPWAPLIGVVDLVEGGIDHPIGQLIRAVDEVGAEESVEFALIGHRRRPPATATGRSSASMAARIARWA